MKKVLCVIIAAFMLLLTVGVAAEQSPETTDRQWEVGAAVKYSGKLATGENLVATGSARIGSDGNGNVLGTAIAIDSLTPLSKYQSVELKLDADAKVTFLHDSASNDKYSSMMYYVELPADVETAITLNVQFESELIFKDVVSCTYVDPSKLEKEEGETEDKDKEPYYEIVTQDEKTEAVIDTIAGSAYIISEGSSKWTAVNATNGAIALPKGFKGYVRYDYNSFTYDNADFPELYHTCDVPYCANNDKSRPVESHLCQIKSDILKTTVSFANVTKENAVNISAPILIDNFTNKTEPVLAIVSGVAKNIFTGEDFKPGDKADYTGYNIMTVGVENFNFKYAKYLENSNFALHVDANSTEFCVYDKASGMAWFSNPQVSAEDRRGVNNLVIDSQIIITYLNPSGERTTGTTYGKQSKKSVQQCLSNGKVSGFLATYNFDHESVQIEVPIAVNLTDKGITVEIVYDMVKENGPTQLGSIDLLPMFGAARATDDGYLFIPDGSGAIVYHSDMIDGYHSNAENFCDYQETVYGSDPSMNLNIKTPSVNEGIKMPIYGSKIKDSAYFANIVSGDGIASVKATSSVSAYRLASVWTSFYYRELDSVGLMTSDGFTRSVNLTDPNMASENPIVEFDFLRGDKANYSGMAECYRNYLVNEYSLEKLSEQNIAPIIQAFGKTTNAETFFGIPIKKAVAATTLSDVEGMYDTLTELGVENSKYFLYGFNKGGYQNKYSRRFGIDGKVGGKKGLESLVSKVGANNVFMGYDILHDYNFGGLFADSKYIASLNKVTILKKSVLLSTGNWIDTLDWKIISNPTLLKTGTKIIDTTPNDLGVGIVFENMGSELYNDFDVKNATDRNGFINSYNQLNKYASDKGMQVGADGANIYMAAYADMINEIPMSSSNHHLFSKSVPVYSMVLHGYVNLSSKPINNSADRDEAIAYCAQFGVMPTYRLTAMESYKFKDSEFRFLYNSCFDYWKDDIADHYAYMQVFSADLTDKVIVSHEYVGDLSITEYENGVKLVYNAGDVEQTIPGTDIVVAARTLRRI